MRALKLYLLLALLILAAGCSKPTVIRKYYLIEPPELLKTSPPAPAKLSDKFCEILPVRISPAFGTHKIAVRVAPKEISYYVYHQWAVGPRDAITRFVELEMQAAGLFQRVGVELWKFNPEFKVISDVQYLEMAMDKKKAVAHLAMSLSLVREYDQVEVVTHRFDRYQPLHKRNLNLFSEAVSDMLHEELNQFAEKIRRWATQPTPEAK